MTGHELRAQYLEYFRREGHTVLPSSSLVPNDPTLLFTSAGMVQFKDIFWGRVPPAHPRVTTCQKCFRTTDIERVGTTAYHHTFFEMLGNFSFGDYFKEGAIALAWRFLTRELGLPPERLWVSVYEEDDEAAALWRKIAGMPPERIVRLGKEHNWWGPVGDRGPCGPDSEIYWDWGLPPCGPECKPSCDCGKYSEIWNLVFMQYDAQPDGSLRELAKKNIDTGMGLERMSAVLQGVRSNFDTDLFRPIVQGIEQLANTRPSRDFLSLHHRNAVADHIRAVTLLVADGVLPDSKDDRGSVLNKVVVRMLVATEALQIPLDKVPTLVHPVVESLGNVYPEVRDRAPLAQKVLEAEVESYREIRRRLHRLGGHLSPTSRVLPGQTAFTWYDTHGIPKEHITVFAAERGLTVDWEGFQKELEAQRARSRRGTEVSVGESQEARDSSAAAPQRQTEFLGYTALAAEGTLLEVRPSPSELQLVFDRTPFYAEAGGQIADTGLIENLSRPGRAEVLDVQKSPGGTLHTVRVLAGEFRPGDRCRLVVDEARRRKIERAHTATHLLHAALRQTLGDHVIQAGSSVEPEEFRFDFTHFAPLSPDELRRVEELVYGAVLQDLPLRIEELPLEEAKRRGAIAHFEEEYRGKERVRVVEVPGVSAELCGGTHVRRTGEIGLLVLVAEEAVGAGVRRLRALVGGAAGRYLGDLRRERQELAQLLEVPEPELARGVRRALEEVRALRRRVESLEGELASLRAERLAASAREVSGTRLLSAVVEGGADEAKRFADALAARLGRCAVVVGARAEGKAIVVAKVVDEPRVNAGELVRIASQALGGRGGGRPTFAQGGGPNVQALPRALEEALAFAEGQLRGA
ncbi:MAG: alanine--tRNA ligase [Candidatus Bipolaricaulota bacterium]|nr:alanine--tRNA ligase [Candidatus Bipolaricaulota bacterium]